ncbi:MAG: hypothetical protein K0R92_815 [Lachnospiraceae bacterium]|jgi:RimK family alpha-L-glutamate ligase|nr:hypothetical protein [Lachnospiraceae bacterium]
MKGWLITNAFLNNSKFSEIRNWLVDAARNKGIELINLTNAEVLVILDADFEKKDMNRWNEKPDFVLFWDKDIRLARFLENLGFHLFNSSTAIEICDDKSFTHIQLQSAGIRMPDTIIAPMTYSNIGYNDYEFLTTVMSKLSFPMVVKECFGSFGQQVYLVNDEAELKAKVLEIGAKPMLFQKFIATSKGQDVRLQVVGEQVVASMYRYSDQGDFRANITGGGKMKPYEPTRKQIELAVKCCREIGLDFGGVDLLFGEEQEPIVCEVNSNAHFKNIYDCTGINVADYIMDYIEKKMTS